MRSLGTCRTRDAGAADGGSDARGGEWAIEPGSSPLVVTPAVPPAAKPQARPTVERVRALQQTLTDAGFDPGLIDGIFGPRTKSALRMYIARRPAAPGSQRREGP
jgi:peptidoglycan hydrolase-like protein with peptidoglycan-binding domain